MLGRLTCLTFFAFCALSIPSSASWASTNWQPSSASRLVSAGSSSPVLLSGWPGLLSRSPSSVWVSADEPSESPSPAPDPAPADPTESASPDPAPAVPTETVTETAEPTPEPTVTVTAEPDPEPTVEPEPAPDDAAMMSAGTEAEPTVVAFNTEQMAFFLLWGALTTVLAAASFVSALGRSS